MSVAVSNSEQSGPPESLAIIGMSGRFPGANNLEAFWRNLRDGVESISFFSKQETVSAGVAAGAISDENFVNAGGVLENIDLFDAQFFGFSARDAGNMDPQQRIFLECAWEGLEKAAYNPHTYPGLIGVFAGMAMSSYVFDLYADNEAAASVDHFEVGVGNDKDHLATQVSYKLNLRGPSITLQTACSTSLVAVCMACQSLLNYQCDIALAGGVAADISTSRGYYYQRGGILSQDGHCRPFDSSACGTVPGNGVGIVVLKRLSEAIAGRDHIHAVIKGSAINNDGSAKVGYTAPSVSGQAQVIAMAQAAAGVLPETISYIEAHGTGTPLGDPIEITALSQVFRARSRKKAFCAIGSVKSNIGHLDPAAGVAGLIKTVLALEHSSLPPSLHFREANPEIDFANSPFYVNTKLTDWNSNGTPRRAGVSSFGIGGTNAHVVLEEAPPVEKTPNIRACSLLVLSARTNTALEVATDNLAEYLGQNPGVEPSDVAYTLQVGRKAFKHRRAVVCNNEAVQDARIALEKRDPLRVFSATCGSKEPYVVFMFPGQGTQRVEMAGGLYQKEPTFRKQVDRCCEILRSLSGVDLREFIYSNSERERAENALEQTALTQPALFTVEYALAKLWMEWGIRPAAMIGHSLGEYVAACLAGVFSLEDALALVAVRGQLMGEMPRGAMAAVSLSEAEVQPLLGEHLALAAVNTPSFCVLSGSLDAIDKLAEDLENREKVCRRLLTSHAFHSHLMAPVESRFVEKMKATKLNAPRIPYLSNLTGTWITPFAATSPDYWGKHLRQTVRFGEGLQELLNTRECVLLEVGPGETLSILARQQSAKTEPAVFSSLPKAGKPELDTPSMLHTLGRLWLCGAKVDFDGFHCQEQRQRLPLPTYPFERQSYWLPSVADHAVSSDAVSTSVSRDIGQWCYYPSWKPGLPEMFDPRDWQTTSHWLLFEDQNGFGSELSERLRERSGEVTRVLAGDQFARLDSNRYTIRPQERADYEALLHELQQTSGLPDSIVHLWTLPLAQQEEVDPALFDQWQRLGFHSVILLAQALEKYPTPREIRLSVVSSQIQAVRGDEPLCPAKATVLGVCKVVPQEYPRLKCQSIDVDLCEPSLRDEKKLLERLITELSASPSESTIAYRKERRWIQTFEHVTLEGIGAGTGRLRHGGVFLITGGLGKIGLILAESLARRVKAAKLVLIGRSAFPDRRQWNRFAEVGDATTRHKILRLLELEEHGAEVMVFSADVANREQILRVIGEVDTRYGAIHGVIHGAADTDAYAFINQTDKAAAERHFGAKVRGLLILQELLRDRELDFFLLLSSLSSQLGGVGQAAYSAANAFMDAFAAQRNRKGHVPWITVNWDAWDFSADGEESSADGPFILPDEGAAAFERILERAPSQVLVSPSDLQMTFVHWVNSESLKVKEEVGPRRPISQHPRPELTNPYVSPKSEIERTLCEIWQQLLGVAPIGASDNFFELGGHSLLAIQLISRLREAFQLEMPLRNLFETPTIAELAERIDSSKPVAEHRETRTAKVLDLVERLSETQLMTLLEEKSAELPHKELPVE